MRGGRQDGVTIYCYTCQVITATKRIISDAGYGIGDDDARQTVTIPKCISSNTGHRIGNSDASQTATARECFKY